MKRKHAFRKLRTICQRLDEIDPQTFPIIPLRLYLFGSVLTDKLNPSDVDLLLDYNERPDLDPGEAVYLLSRGNLPHDRAIRILRKGMQMMRFHLLLEETVEKWLKNHYFAPETPIELVWESGLDWQPIIDALESRPLPWDEALEKHNKQRKETAEKIAREQGESAAVAWLKSQP